MHSVGHKSRIHTESLLWHENILKIQHVITVGFVYSPLFEGVSEV